MKKGNICFSYFSPPSLFIVLMMYNNILIGFVRLDSRLNFVISLYGQWYGPINISAIIIKSAFCSYCTCIIRLQ